MKAYIFFTIIVKCLREFYTEKNNRSSSSTQHSQNGFKEVKFLNIPDI